MGSLEERNRVAFGGTVNTAVFLGETETSRSKTEKAAAVQTLKVLPAPPDWLRYLLAVHLPTIV